jgi:hypothetical protein
MNPLELDLARSQRRREIQIWFIPLAVLAGVFAPLYLSALLGPGHVAGIRDNSMIAMMLVPFAAVWALGWLVARIATASFKIQ